MDNDIDYEYQVPDGTLTGIKVGVLTEADAEKISVISIETPAGVTDPRLGFPNPSSQCATCGARSTKNCEGHFGVINFPYTVLHPYFISEVVQILNQICPKCKSIRRERRAKGAKSNARSDQQRNCTYCARPRLVEGNTHRLSLFSGSALSSVVQFSEAHAASFYQLKLGNQPDLGCQQRGNMYKSNVDAATFGEEGSGVDAVIQHNNGSVAQAIATEFELKTSFWSSIQWC